MPNALTHFYIYEKAVERICKENWGDDRLLKVFPKMMTIGMGFENGGKDRPSLKSVLRNLANSWMELGPALMRTTKGKKREYATLASYGYLGSNGPDMFFVPPHILKTNLATNTLSTLMHHNTVGASVIYGLILLKEQMSKKLTREEKILWLCKLAYWLGHITHIAADITVHPFVNSRAGANKLLLKKMFFNFRGSTRKGVWTLHNIVEQYQDRYVLQKYYKGESSFRAMAFASMAALHLREKPEHRFIGETIDEFYGQDYAGKQDYDKAGCKYEYCRAWYWLDSKVRSHMSFRNYVKNVVPSKKQLEVNEGFLVGPDDFDSHIAGAVNLSVEVLKEAVNFLKGNTPAQGDSPRKKVYSVRNEFELLYANFNIDAGLCFRFNKCDQTAKIGATKGIACRVPLRVELKTYNGRGDGIPAWKYSTAAGDGAVGPASSGRKKVVKQYYKYWGADVVTEKGDQRSGFGLFTASRSDHDQDTVGEKICLEKEGYRLLSASDVKSLWVDYGDGSRVSVLSPIRGEATRNWFARQFLRSKKDYPELNHVCDKMIVPTVGTERVWKYEYHSLGWLYGENFDPEKVSQRDTSFPTEQLFLKFHFFKEEGEGEYKHWPGGLSGPPRVPFEPGINNIAVVVDSQDKLKRVYLDHQKVWDANEGG